MLLKHLELLKSNLKEDEAKITSEIEKFEHQTEIVDSIPGIDKSASSAIIAEIGIDMSCFNTAERICSWAGLSPGNNESAGKKKRTKVNWGNPYIKSILCEVAWVITRLRSTYLSEWYWRMKQRKGAKKAIVALARKLLVIIYTMLKSDTSFDESLFEVRRIKSEGKKVSRMILELKNLGYTVAQPA